MGEPIAYTSIVRPEWIDHNGHMNVAYYVLAFDEATDAAYEAWGIGLDYPERSNCSVFTLGMNVDYRSELFAGDAITVETVLVDIDHKRIHYFHRMLNAASGALAATNECLCMNVNLETRKSEAFAPHVMEMLERALHGGDRPDGFGRRLAIRRP